MKYGHVLPEGSNCSIGIWGKRGEGRWEMGEGERSGVWMAMVKLVESLARVDKRRQA